MTNCTKFSMQVLKTETKIVSELIELTDTLTDLNLSFKEPRSFKF